VNHIVPENRSFLLFVILKRTKLTLISSEQGFMFDRIAIEQDLLTCTLITFIHSEGTLRILGRTDLMMDSGRTRQNKTKKLNKIF